VASISIMIGSLKRSPSIGCYPSNNTKAHKDHGGNALTVMKYSIQLQCVRATTATHSLVTADRVNLEFYQVDPT
jgi:hypothetical protein